LDFAGLLPLKVKQSFYVLELLALLRSILAVGVNKLLNCRVVRAGSSLQNPGFLVHNWSLTSAEARAEIDSSGVCLFQIPNSLMYFVNKSNIQLLYTGRVVSPIGSKFIGEDSYCNEAFLAHVLCQ